MTFLISTPQVVVQKMCLFIYNLQLIALISHPVGQGSETLTMHSCFHVNWHWFGSFSPILDCSTGFIVTIPPIKVLFIGLQELKSWKLFYFHICILCKVSPILDWLTV